jgi:hypothetical protein
MWQRDHIVRALVDYAGKVLSVTDIQIADHTQLPTPAQRLRTWPNR